MTLDEFEQYELDRKTKPIQDWLNMQARIERLADAPRHGVLQNPKTCSHMDVDYVGHCCLCGAYFDGSHR